MSGFNYRTDRNEQCRISSFQVALAGGTELLGPDWFATLVGGLIWLAGRQVGNLHVSGSRRNQNKFVMRSDKKHL